jgi:hypothetical protein
MAEHSMCQPRGPFRVGRLLGLGSLPEHEVQRIELAVIDRHALAGAQVVDALAAQLAIAVELAHRVVHVAALGPVGQAALFQALDQRQHLRHVFGRTRLVVGAQQPDGGEVLVHRGRHLLGQLADGDATLDRALDDLVVDVRHVAHIGDGIAAGAQPAVDDVERHVHAQVPHVAQVVDRDAAHVHAHLARHERLKVFEGAAEGVVDAQGHGTVRREATP